MFIEIRSVLGIAYITSVIKEIQEIQRTLERGGGVMSFSQKNPEKIGESIAKLTEVRIILNDAIGLLLDSGNTKKNL